MSIDLYDYHLPPEHIAQEPPGRRGDSRLLILDRGRGTLEHRRFAEIGSYLRPGDLLVVNETRVFPARLFVRRPTGARTEVFLLEPIDGGPAWRALGRPARTLVSGARFPVIGSVAEAVAAGRDGEAVIVEFVLDGRSLGVEEVLALCEATGTVPVPPYIRRLPGDARGELDRERYQTVYARRTGAVAAPTAGLHFTPEILRDAEDRGARVVPVTLHVGAGTFRPLTETTFASDRLHAERIEIDETSGRAILEARREGRRIVAVGTTSVRAVESFLADPRLPYSGPTELFIKPGYEFRGVSALVTNFHLPRSSLLVLVSAFAGRERILAAYEEAVREGYRFYSYGDAMLIL